MKAWPGGAGGPGAEGAVLPALAGLSPIPGIVPKCQPLFFFFMTKALPSSPSSPLLPKWIYHSAAPCSPPPISSSPPLYRPPREVEGVVVYFSRLFPIRPSLFGVGLGGWGSK